MVLPAYCHNLSCLSSRYGRLKIVVHYIISFLCLSLYLSVMIIYFGFRRTIWPYEIKLAVWQKNCQKKHSETLVLRSSIIMHFGYIICGATRHCRASVTITRQSRYLERYLENLDAFYKRALSNINLKDLNANSERKQALTLLSDVHVLIVNQAQNERKTLRDRSWYITRHQRGSKIRSIRLVWQSVGGNVS